MQAAVWVLIVTIMLGLLLTLYSYDRIGFARIFHLAPLSILVTVVFQSAWVAVVFVLTQRHGWARFVAASLLVYGVATLVIGFSRVHWHGMFQGTMILTWLIAAVRGAAIAMLFTPESNAWFASRPVSPEGSSAAPVGSL